MSSESYTICDWVDEVQRYVHVLRDSLSLYYGRSIRVAIITQDCSHEVPNQPIWVFDPDELLEPHRDAFRQYFHSSQQWQTSERVCFGQDQPLALPSLPGVIGTARRIMHTALDGTVVAIFADAIPGPSSGPVSHWLSSAATFLAGDIVYRSERRSDPFRVPSEATVRSFAPQAVAQYIAGLWRGCGGSPIYEDVQYAVTILDSLRRICTTSEERQLPSGMLFVLRPNQSSDLDLIARFQSPLPQIGNAKHAGKLLRTVSGSSTDCLVCTETANIIGIGTIDNLPTHSIRAEFAGGRARIFVCDEHICSISRGDVVAGASPDLSSLRKALEATDTQVTAGVQDAIDQLVTKALDDAHGCTLVLDFRQSPSSLSGQELSPPLNLVRAKRAQTIAAAMSAIDGAVHVDRDGNLRTFGCLLDGTSHEAEDRSRGARYNSALRYASKHPDTLVVVVSEDGHMSVFSKTVGLPIQPTPNVSLKYIRDMPTLPSWLAGP